MYSSSQTDIRSGCVIFDLDGVLCDVSERLQSWLDECAISDVPPDWQKWWPTLAHDNSKPEYVALARLLREAGYGIIVLTARLEEAQEVTEEWLSRHLPFGYDMLEMRDASCSFEDCKRIAVLELMESFDIRLAIDDELYWVNMYRSLGIPAIHAQHGHDTMWTDAASRIQRMMSASEG